MSTPNQALLCEYLSIMDSVYGKVPEDKKLNPALPPDSVNKSKTSIQPPHSVSLSFIARALVRSDAGDIAAAALPYDDRNTFYLLFANNRSARDELDDLELDAKHVANLSTMLQEMYAAQLPLLQDATDLQKCQITHANKLLDFVLQSDAKKILLRKLKSTKRLGHGAEDTQERKDHDEHCQGTLETYVSKAASKYPANQYEGLRKYLNITSPDIPREVVLAEAVKFLHTKYHPDNVSLPEFLDFVTFCRLILKEPIFKVAKTRYRYPNEMDLVLGKLYRRLTRIVTYESGSKAVAGSLLSYIRNVLNNRPLTLKPVIIAKELQDERVGPLKHTTTAGLVIQSLQANAPKHRKPKDVVLREKNRWQLDWDLTPTPRIHAELRLIIYALLRNLDISRVIGISKMPCLSCHCYLGKLQAELLKTMKKDVRWKTSGSSWKPHVAWAIPMFSEVSMSNLRHPDGIAITKQFLQKVAKETETALRTLAIEGVCIVPPPRRVSASDSSAGEITDEEEVGPAQGGSSSK